MGKYVVVIEAFDDEDAKEFAKDGGRGMVRAIHPVYRDAYDIDYDMTIFRCKPPVGDPQPLLADEEYEFQIGLATTPENFERIQDRVEKLASGLGIDYLSYTSKGKPVPDGN